MAADSSANDEYPPMAVAELHALLDAAVDAIVVIDERGKISTFNKAAERMFGYRAVDVVGRDIGVLMGDGDAAEHARHVERYLATGEAHIIGIGREVQARRANGETFPIALSVGEAADATGRRFVGILRDLSGQRAAEQRTRSLETRLSHVGRFNLMGEMAAGIAHEINQPLSAIATYAQAAKRLMQQPQPNVDMLRDVCATTRRAAPARSSRTCASSSASRRFTRSPST
jgi:two-component system sensor kinase FixL